MDDLRAALVTVLLLDLQRFVLDDLHAKTLIGEHRAQVVDQLHQLGMLIADLVALETGEPLQAHIQDGLRLDLAQPELFHEAVPGLIGGLAGADQPDHRVQMVQCDEQTLEDMGALLRLPQIELGAPHHHVMPVVDETRDHVLQAQQHGTAAHKRDAVDAETGLERTELVQLIEDHTTHGLALHLISEADARAVAVVIDITDALDLLVVHQVGHSLVELHRLVRLERDLGADDRLATGFHVLLDVAPGAQYDPPPPGLVGLADPVNTLDDTTCREVRPLDVLHEAGSIDVLVLDVRGDPIANLVEVVRWHVRGHAHGDARCPVHQQVRDARRHHARLLQRVVEIGAHVHRFLVQVGEHLFGDLLEARLGISHGRRAVPIDAAEVALPVHKRIAQAPLLCHAHHGIVNTAITVRVVLTQYFTNDTRALFVGSVAQHAQVLHAVEHAAVHGFQSIAHVGQSPADDHRHRIIDVGGAHFVLDVDRYDLLSFCHVCQFVTLARSL